MLAFSNDYYGFIFRVTQSVELFCTYEATAFSDPENEYLIQKAFEKLMQDKTVIMIAHRLSTIRNANKIIVMENGRLIESGKHNDLIQKNGRYAEMWKHYTEAIDLKVQTKVVQ